MNRISVTIPLRPECIVTARLAAGSVAKILKLGIDDAEDLKLVTNEGCSILFAQKFEGCEVVFDWTEGLSVSFAGIPGKERVVCDQDALSINLLLLEGLCDFVEAPRSGIMQSILVKKKY